MSEELKDCPACQGPPGTLRGGSVQCKNCGIWSPDSETWNHRTPTLITERMVRFSKVVLECDARGMDPNYRAILEAFVKEWARI